MAISIIIFMIIAAIMMLDAILESLDLKIQQTSNKADYVSNQFSRIIWLTLLGVVLFGLKHLAIENIVLIAIVGIIGLSINAGLVEKYKHYPIPTRIFRGFMRAIFKPMLSVFFAALIIAILFEMGEPLQFVHVGFTVFFGVVIVYVLLMEIALPGLVKTVPYTMPFDSTLKTLDENLSKRLYLVRTKRVRLPINALFAGFFNRAKVLLSSALLSRLRAHEIKGVVAHEAGHRKHGHLWVRFGLIALVIFVYMFIVATVYNSSLHTRMGLPDAFLSRLFTMIVLFYIAESLLMIVFYRLSHHQEYAADRFAASHGFAGALADALETIDRYQPDPVHHPLSRKLRVSHPSSEDRIARLRSMEVSR